MAHLTSLVHELRERIAASSSTPLDEKYDADLQSRFRAVLPNLLNAYVVPSSSAKEREVIAILKLLANTAKNFPGVFYHGKASAVVPIICRILPFFAEPVFRYRHGVIFETIVSLLSLLRTGDRDAYRQFFMDTMSLTEDLVYIASISDKTNSMEPNKMLLKSFCESFSGMSNDVAILCELPLCIKPVNGDGILIDLTGKDRLLPFAASAVKLLCKCLTDGTVYVERLLDASCVLAVCKLLCYGDDDLHMACFDFVRLTRAGKNCEIIPTEKLIKSMVIILSEDVEGISVFRNAGYDSSLGECLQALHSGCSNDVLRSTAADVVCIFPESMLKTTSLELKDGLCSAYIRIANICPPHIWKPNCLISMLSSSKPLLHLVDCLKVAVSRLGPELVGKLMLDDHCSSIPVSIDNDHDSSKVGGKRPFQDIETSERKRQKIHNICKNSGTTSQDVCTPMSCLTGAREKEYADYMCTSLNLSVKFLEPPKDRSNSSRTEISLTAITSLCVVFSEHPHTDLSLCIFRQMCKWISWVSEQVKQELPFPHDVSTFLEAVDSLLLLEGSSSKENMFLIFESNGEIGDILRPLLKLPWNSTSSTIRSHPPWKAKCLSIRILSRVGWITQNGLDLNILDLGLQDEEEEVRIEAVISMPMILLCSGFGFLTHIFNRLK